MLRLSLVMTNLYAVEDGESVVSAQRVDLSVQLDYARCRPVLHMFIQLSKLYDLCAINFIIIFLFKGIS